MFIEGSVWSSVQISQQRKCYKAPGFVQNSQQLMVFVLKHYVTLHNNWLHKSKIFTYATQKLWNLKLKITLCTCKQWISKNNFKKIHGTLSSFSIFIETWFITVYITILCRQILDQQTWLSVKNDNIIWYYVSQNLS